MKFLRILCLLHSLCWGISAEDLRLTVLDKYFQHLPARHFTAEMLSAADQYNLDWRLLPAICFIESTGGLHPARANNWFGWSNGLTRFQSVPEAIQCVARALSENPNYRGRTLWQKLHTYNPQRQYPAKVLRVMNLLGH